MMSGLGLGATERFTVVLLLLLRSPHHPGVHYSFFVSSSFFLFPVEAENPVLIKRILFSSCLRQPEAQASNRIKPPTVGEAVPAQGQL